MTAVNQSCICRQFKQISTSNKLRKMGIIARTNFSTSSSSTYIDRKDNVVFTFGLPPPASYNKRPQHTLPTTTTTRTSNDNNIRQKPKPITVIFASCYQQDHKENEDHYHQDDVFNNQYDYYTDRKNNNKMKKSIKSPWKTILEQNPDLVLLMGDTVYPKGLDINDDFYDHSHSNMSDKICNERTKKMKQIVDSLKHSYQTLANDVDFQKLYTTIPIIATLDDNDYLFLKTKNNNQYNNTDDKMKHDCNRNKQKVEQQQQLDQQYLKDVAKQMFCDFWQLSKDDPRRFENRGVYCSTELSFQSMEEDSNQRNDSTPSTKATATATTAIQVITLDNRYHLNPHFLVDDNVSHSYRSNNFQQHQQVEIQQQYPKTAQHDDDDNENDEDNNSTGPYVPNNDLNATVLGQSQWNWLQNQLSIGGEEKYNDNKDSDSIKRNTSSNILRIIVSSIQVVSSGHCWDCWNMVPHERQRLLDLLLSSSTKHNNDSQIRTVILSGDRHCGGVYLYDNESKNTSNNCWDQMSSATSVDNNLTTVDTIRLTNNSLIEVTSSSLTHTCPVGVLDNEYDTTRVGDLLCGVNNFGRIVISTNSSLSNSTDQQKSKSDPSNHDRYIPITYTHSDNVTTSTSNEVLQLTLELRDALNGELVRTINVSN
jgi:PhoD-like phosphatase